MKNQGSITLVKEHNFLGTEPKETKTCDLPDKKFKIVVLRKLSEPQVTRENQFNKNQGYFWHFLMVFFNTQTKRSLTETQKS